MIHTLTLAELRQHYGYTLREPLDDDERRRVPATIPTLDEFLAFVSGYDRLRIVYFDLKIPEEQAALTPLYYGLIRQALAKNPPRYTYVFITPHEEILAQLEQMDSTANFSFDVEPEPGLILRPWEKNSVRTAIQLGNAYASTVHPKASTWAPWTTLKRLIEYDVLMRDEHNRVHPGSPIRAVIAATITEPEKMRCLIASGVDGLITDDPATLRRVAREMGRRVE